MSKCLAARGNALLAARPCRQDDDGVGIDDDEGIDDMGLGVTQTVKKRKGITIQDATSARENIIFEIADAAQDIADSMLPPDEFDRYQRKSKSESKSGLRGRSPADGEGDDGGGNVIEDGDDDDLGM